MVHAVPTPFYIGACGEYPSSDLESSDWIVGEIQKPRFHPATTPDPHAGIDWTGVVQFFNLASFQVSGLRAHSCLQFEWDSTGALTWLRLDNYKGDITFTLLWDRNEPDTGPLDWRGAYLDSTDCPVDLPWSSDSSDVIGDNAGFIVRIMVLTGYYGHDSSDITPSSDLNASVPSSDDWLKVRYSAQLIDCEPPISSFDATLGQVATEMALEFDSKGLLDKVYWSGGADCATHNIVWDRNNPPDGTAGVVVPIIKFLLDDDNNNFEIWQWHFASTGHYIHSTFYGRMCGCDTGVSIDPTPPCICPEFACIVTNNCTRSGEPDYCPATVTFDCSVAAINAGNCEPVASMFCVYSRTDGCCTPGDDANVFSSDMTGGLSSDGEACEMQGDGGACTA